jgi:hypothetical protein
MTPRVTALIDDGCRRWWPTADVGVVIQGG